MRIRMNRMAAVLASLGLIVVLGACDVSRASVSDRGGEANGASATPPHARALSADGRWVLFGSDASNLVQGDTNGTGDVFVRDQVAKRTIRVSQTPDGRQLDAYASAGSMSGDGRLVTFATNAAAVQPAAGPRLTYGFLSDHGRVSLITRDDDGTPIGNPMGDAPVVSANGRWVAYAGQRAGDETLHDFVLDLHTRTVVEVLLAQNHRPLAISDDGRSMLAGFACGLGCRAGVNAIFDPWTGAGVWGTPATIPEYQYGYPSSVMATMTDDGRYVAYSESPGCFGIPFLDFDACNRQPREIRIVDRVGGTTVVAASHATADEYNDFALSADGSTLVFAEGPNLSGWSRTMGSINVPPAVAPNGPSWAPAISADGSTFAMTTLATNLGPTDTNGVADVITLNRSRGNPANAGR